MIEQRSMVVNYLLAAQDCLLEGQPTLALAFAKRALSEANTFNDHVRKPTIMRVINYLRLVVRRSEVQS
jgi:hypothetical protein